MKNILSILLFIFTLLLLPFFIVLDLIAPKYSDKIKNALLQVEKKIKGDVEQEKSASNTAQFSENPSFKKPTIYVSPSSPSYQPWNEIPKFDNDDEDKFHNEHKESSNIDLSALYRYELDYKDRFGKSSTRYIDVTGVQKQFGNNRWYFVADTADGERTFKSERVVELRDNWTSDVFSTSESVRKHLVKNYPEVNNAFED